MVQLPSHSYMIMYIDLPDADDWKLVPATDVTSNKIEFLDLANGTDLLLEWKNTDGKYQRTGQVLAGRTWGQFQVITLYS